MLREAAVWMWGSPRPVKQGPAHIQAGIPLAGAVISLFRKETQFILPGCSFHTGFKEGKPHQDTAQPVHEAERDFLTQAVPCLP